jgi:hypothetical protein
MTTPDIAGLCERLRAVESSGHGGVTTNWHRNPDGPEAADTLERQAAEIKRLRGALEVARHALVCTENLRCTDQSIEALAAKLVNGVPRDQLEFMTNFASELAVIDAALTGEDTATLGLSGKTQTGGDACTL